MSRHDGQRVLVTAAGAGIGRRIAERFAEEGAQVFACDLDAMALESLPSSIHRRAADVADPAAVAGLFAAADAALSGLDVLVAAAGTAGPIAPVEETEPDAWRRCVEVSLYGTYLCARAAASRLKAAGGGSIIAFSSTAGLHGYPQRTAYCAAKWGVIGLVKSLATELGPHRIRVNAICPGVVEGERMDRVIAGEAAARGVAEEAVRAAYTEGSSLRQWVTADDLAAMALFLASDGAAKISGQALPVDGHTEARY
ncbi:MAG: SDR family oxidoreductase [Alphaproteobacteria bacterium]|nr:SDR family oxidoreductase [Alphaproteobacteria bacterium]